MGYKDDLIRARDITASNYRQGKMSPYDDPFNDTYYDQEGWNKELAEAASKDDKINIDHMSVESIDNLYGGRNK